MDEFTPRKPSTEPRFDRRTLIALAGGLAVAAIETRAGHAIPLPAVTGSWELPAHDLAATRRGGRIAGTRVDWRAELRGGVAGAPAIVGGSVYAASIGGVIASLDLATGHARWRRQFPTPLYGSGAGARRLGFFGGVAVAEGRVVAASDHVVALDKRVARRRLWHRRLTPALSKKASVAGPMNGPEGGPVATDGTRIYVLSSDAARNSCVAAALEPATGRVLWRQRLPSFSFAAPALAGDRLFATGADGMLRGLDTTTGKVVAAVPLGAPSTGAPAVAEGRLVVGAGAEPFLPGHLLVCIGPHRSHR